MAKVYQFLATGFEEIEALIPLDIMRRGGVEFVNVSVTGSRVVEGAHGVKIEATCSCCPADCPALPTSMCTRA